MRSSTAIFSVDKIEVEETKWQFCIESIDFGTKLLHVAVSIFVTNQSTESMNMLMIFVSSDFPYIEHGRLKPW